MKWRSMESAPEDGTYVLIYCPGNYHNDIWIDYYGCMGRDPETDCSIYGWGDDAVAWMPLPKPPNGRKT